MHKRMRRGKEMYPSFDTRRVLCKQHRPYCVKPLRARLKQSNASNAESILSVASEPKRFGWLKSIVLTPVATKTTAEGQSISAWSAMSPLAFALLIRPDWQTEQKALYVAGESTTDLKPSRNRPTKSRLRSAQSEHGRNGLSSSRLHGEGKRWLRLGQDTLWRLEKAPGWLITKITKKTNNDLASTRAKRGKNTKAARNGEKKETVWLCCIGRKTDKNTTNTTSVGGLRTQKNGKRANVNSVQILCFVQCKTFANAYGKRCAASEVAHQLLAAPA